MAIGPFIVHGLPVFGGGLGRFILRGLTTGAGGVPPVASFVGVPTSGFAPLTVQFTDQSSGFPTSWAWDFGDGGSSTQQNPLYVYTTPGTYTVQLTVTNAVDTDKGVISAYISVSQAPAPTFVPVYRLLHSPAQVVQQLLIDSGIASDPDAGADWPCYSTNEPEGDLDDQVTVTDTAAVDQGRSQPTGEQDLHYGVQVRVRGADHLAWRKAIEIQEYASRTAYQNVVVLEGISYLVYNFSQVGGVLAVGKDVPTAKRSIFTLNPTVVIRRLYS